MGEPLAETEYDVIVVGTALPHAVAAAALARIGRRVLHVDAAGFYGQMWSSHTLHSAAQWSAGVSVRARPDPPLRIRTALMSTLPWPCGGGVGCRGAAGGGGSA